MLGSFGLPEERVHSMTLPELDGFLALARSLMQLARPAPPILPALPAPPPAGGKTTTFISRRKNKT